MSFESRIKLLDALLKLTPESFQLRWERSELWGLWGNALLKEGKTDEALEKYRSGIQDKVLAISADCDLPKQDSFFICLAENYLGIALLEQVMKRADDARADCQESIRILENVDFTEELHDRASLVLQDARRVLQEVTRGDYVSSCDSRHKRKATLICTDCETRRET